MKKSKSDLIKLAGSHMSDDIKDAGELDLFQLYSARDNRLKKRIKEFNLFKKELKKSSESGRLISEELSRTIKDCEIIQQPYNIVILMLKTVMAEQIGHQAEGGEIESEFNLVDLQKWVEFYELKADSLNNRILMTKKKPTEYEFLLKKLKSFTLKQLSQYRKKSFDKSEVEDVIQDAVIKVFKNYKNNLSSVPDGAKIKLLQTTIRNLLNDTYTKKTK